MEELTRMRSKNDKLGNKTTDISVIQMLKSAIGEVSAADYSADPQKPMKPIVK